MDSWYFVGKIVCSLFMGVLIGLERQWRGHPAGLRTNALVCLGATLFVSISTLKNDDDSKTRIAAYIVSGIGFLGGGVILRDGFNIRGMNTAATLWCTAAVGTLTGVGYPLQALFGTVCVLVIHVFVRPVAHQIDKIRKNSIHIEVLYKIRIAGNKDQLGRIRLNFLDILKQFPKMSLQGIQIDESKDSKKVELVADVFSLERNDQGLDEITWRLIQETGVNDVSWEKMQ